MRGRAGDPSLSLSHGRLFEEGPTKKYGLEAKDNRKPHIGLEQGVPSDLLWVRLHFCSRL